MERLTFFWKTKPHGCVFHYGRWCGLAGRKCYKLGLNDWRFTEPDRKAGYGFGLRFRHGASNPADELKWSEQLLMSEAVVRRRACHCRTRPIHAGAFHESLQLIPMQACAADRDAFTWTWQRAEDTQNSPIHSRDNLGGAVQYQATTDTVRSGSP